LFVPILISRCSRHRGVFIDAAHFPVKTQRAPRIPTLSIRFREMVLRAEGIACQCHRISFFGF